MLVILFKNLLFLSRGEEDLLEPKIRIPLLATNHYLSMPLEKSVRLAVIVGTILDLAIGIKSSLFKKWVDLVKKVGGYKIFLKKELFS